MGVGGRLRWSRFGGEGGREVVPGFGWAEMGN